MRIAEPLFLNPLRGNRANDALLIDTSGNQRAAITRIKADLLEIKRTNLSTRLEQSSTREIQFTQTISLKRMMNSGASGARESTSHADKEQSNGLSDKSISPIIDKLAAVSKATCQSILLIGGFSPHLSNYPK
ncbi:hypothetical protein FAZ95_26540 [Trinickia violacea]|uniref:Uncharacterized protein n=1 Tax=Trinickia violacea TaxID=2571746 RepID=A0A4P8IW86_9BURK|nr:hypothetical protein [Trinickia violacea]QCP52706.1 hypothetical protein FAZ95_26540 [Trinickia violacea]